MIYNRAFYCAEIPQQGKLAVVDESEKHHIFKVLRAREGDQIILLDGRGKKALAKIAAGQNFEILSIEELSKPQLNIRLYVCPPRHGGMDSLLAFCAETAVSEIIPIICRRSVAIPKNLDKWRKKIIEACKQSKNPFFPALRESQFFEDAVHEAKEWTSFYGSPTGADINSFSLKSSDIAWFVGPEGGFDDDEISLMDKHGFRALRLSQVIMRVETAALAGIILLSNLKRT